jgi:hypothetical protein
MPRDAKVIQRGVNVQSNDYAVPAGTPERAINIDYSRDGVAMRRVGFEKFWDGIPQFSLDNTKDSQQINMGPQRGVWELFSRDHLFSQAHGMLFSYVDSIVGGSYEEGWRSVPTLLSHQFRFHGTIYESVSFDANVWQLGKLVGYSANQGPSQFSPFSCIDTYTSNGAVGGAMIGRITNETSQAVSGTVATSIYNTPFDVVMTTSGGTRVVSDNASIRNGNSGAVIAGTITTTGYTDATGASARFSGASWMATDGSDTVWIADNTNAIRKLVVSTTVVTTLAGSITAGDTDGVGTAARFRTISGLAYDGSQFLYVAESGGSRIRKVDVTSGSVTIFAGALTPTTGFVDAVGTAARFNAPTGIEYINGYLYVGDSSNKVIREIQVSNANVQTYVGISGSAGTATDGLIGGSCYYGVLPGCIVRSKYHAKANTLVGGYETEGRYLAIECTTAGSEMIDLGLVAVVNQGTAAVVSMPERVVLHYGRCPTGYANATNGPMKFDTYGPNIYSQANIIGADVGGGAAFTTREYPRAIDIWTQNLTTNPMPRLRPLGIDAPEAPSCTTVAAGTTFANNTAWAYRTVNGLTLPDGRIALSPPSERIIVTNTSGGTVNGSVTAFPSAGLPYDGMSFVQLYRTKTVASTLDPGDQMFLCYETPLPYGAGAIITDIVPDANLGSELYTNATSETIAAASLRPGLWATDIVAFDNRAVISNYIERASIRIKVLGVTTLVASTSTITFKTYDPATSAGPGTIVLTAIAGATDPSANSFQIGTGGTPAANAAQTARNIVRVINRSPQAYMFTATYDENDAGAFVVTSLFPGVTQNQINTTISDVFVVTSSGTAIQSIVSYSTNASAAFISVNRNNSIRQINKAWYSDPGDFDSFPVGGQFAIGPRTESIQRLLPISERVVVVKDDSIMAFDSTFAVQIYDTALACSTPWSFARLNNQWIGLFTRGFCAINSTQATAIGRPIDRDVTSTYNQYFALSTKNFASAAAIDVYGNYVCTFNKRTFVWNAISQSWSEWEINSVTPQSDIDEGNAFYYKSSSGMRFIGAYKDCFVTNYIGERSYFRQRDWRRSSTEWYHDYGDMSWTVDGVLGADLQTITVSAYTAFSLTNPTAFPPFNRTPPPGSTTAPSAAETDSRFILFCEQSPYNGYFQGTVAVATPALSSSAMTITATEAFSPSSAPFVAGSITVTLYAPILCRLQYAPTVTPGVNTTFSETVVSAERTQPGWLHARYFGRGDIGSALETGIATYDDDQGVCRATLMGSLTSDFNGNDGKIAYNGVHRIEVASERAMNQSLVLELWEANAWQPLAFKAVVVEYTPKDNSKVNQ